MQTGSFRGLGEPAWVNAYSNACEGLGPYPRTALGPAAIHAASTGRTRDRTRPCCIKSSGIQPLAEESANCVQCLSGRVQFADAPDESVWHSAPHVDPRIDAGGNSAFNVAPRIV